jgi:hypothetical protein
MIDNIEKSKVQENVKHNCLAYFYCDHHDDAFCIITDPSTDVSSLNWKAKCCLKNKSCDLIYIGTRVYDGNNLLIIDSTPNKEYFFRKGGGYSREYLDNASIIVLNK